MLADFVLAEVVEVVPGVLVPLTLRNVCFGCSFPPWHQILSVGAQVIQKWGYIFMIDNIIDIFVEKTKKLLVDVILITQFLFVFLHDFFSKRSAN